RPCGPVTLDAATWYSGSSTSTATTSATPAKTGVCVDTLRHLPAPRCTRAIRSASEQLDESGGAFRQPLPVLGHVGVDELVLLEVGKSGRQLDIGTVDRRRVAAFGVDRLPLG